VDEPLASACISALRRVAKKLKLKDDLSAQTLTHLPEVIKVWRAIGDLVQDMGVLGSPASRRRVASRTHVGR
jgi:hypothetical protein